MCVSIFFSDSEDEMSSDSLNLASHEDDSSGEEAQMQESLRRKKSSAAVSQLEYFFVPAETDLQKDKPEQQSEPLMVTYFHIPMGFIILLKC